MAVFALVLERGPRWDPSRAIREQEGWDPHAAFMDGLVTDGVVLLGGPLADETVLLCTRADDEPALRARFRSDPWHHAGLLRIARVTRWELWLDGLSPADEVSRG